MNDEQLAAGIKRAFARYRMEPRPIDSPASALDGQGVLPARPPLLARRRLLGGLSLAGVATAVVLAFALSLGLGPGANRPASVWAAWQSTPTKPDEAMRSAAGSRCRGTLNINGSDKIAGSSFSYDDLKLIAQDQRGPAALFMFARDTTYWACMVWPNDFGTYDAMGLGSSSEMHPLSGHIEAVTEGGALEPAGQAQPNDPRVVTIFGRTDASKLLVQRPDGVQIQATINDGVFVAWWPGGGGTATLIAYDAAGRALESMVPFATPCYCKVQPASPNSGN